MPLNLGSQVIFKHENEEFSLQNGQIVLNRYYEEFYGDKVVNFVIDCSHQNVRMFFRFLQTGEVPNLFEDQIQVFQLLKEWDCCFTAFDSFRFRIQAHSRNGLISHHDKLYHVNIGCLFFHSTVFQEFYKNNPYEVFVINDEYSPNSIRVFLDLIHSQIKQPELKDADEVLELCCFLGCSSLCALINESSAESILSIILHRQDDDSFDFSFFEKVIVEDLKNYILLADFGKVSIPFLIRVFQRTYSTFTINQLQLFFQHCVEFHGSKASILLSKIRFHPAKSIEEFHQFLNIFSEKQSDDFFSRNRDILGEFSKKYDKGQEEISKMKSIVDDMKKQMEEDRKMIKELNNQLDVLKKNQQKDERQIQENNSLRDDNRQKKKVFAPQRGIRRRINEVEYIKREGNREREDGNDNVEGDLTYQFLIPEPYKEFGNCFYPFQERS